MSFKHGLVSLLAGVPEAFAALARTGYRVFTEQKISAVGDTGRATGCHLHFEMWTAPGWYEGGRPFDPLPSLKAWDAVRIPPERPSCGRGSGELALTAWCPRVPGDPG